MLYHVADLTVEEIAAETGVRPGTVKARLARGRAALAPYLRETAAPVTGRMTSREEFEMVDLKDELQQLADDAARQTRPMAVAQVIPGWRPRAPADHPR